MKKDKRSKEDLLKRELELEAVVQGMLDTFEHFRNIGGGIVGSIAHQSGIDGLMLELYNTAEVSHDITDKVKLNITFEE